MRRATGRSLAASRPTWNALRGRVVRSRFELRNGCGSVPAGTLFRVVEVTGRGMLLDRLNACQCCGLRFRVGRVAVESVDLIDEAALTPQRQEVTP